MDNIIEIVAKDTIVVEQADNKVIVIEPKVIINQTTGGGTWGTITGDIGEQSDLVAEFAKKMDIEPTVLPIDTSYDTLITNGVYQRDYAIITVKVAEESDAGRVVNQVLTLDDGTMQYRQYQNGAWIDWKEVAWWGYTLEELALKENLAPTVLASGTDADNVTGDGKYAIDNSILCVYNVGTVTYQTFITDEYTMMFRMGEGGGWNDWVKLANESDIANLYTALADGIGDVMSTIDDKVDKIAGKGLSTNDYTNADKAIVDKVAVIPVNPERMYLNGNKEYTEIISGSGGYANDVFFTYDESDVSGYYKLSYTPPENEVELTATVQASEGTKLIRTYLYDLPIGINIHDAGLWTVSYTARVTSAANETHLIFEAFMRDVNGNETVLFTKTGAELNSTSNMMYTDSTVQPSYIVEPTSRFGIKIYATTTRTVSTSLYTTIGGRDASHFNSPIALRHSQLRDKNQEDAYQHLTADEKDLFLLSDRFRINATDFIGGTASPYQGIVIGGVPVIVKKFLNQNSYYYTTVRLPSDSIYLDNIRFILTESVMPTAGQYIDFTINGTLLRHAFNGKEVQNQMITTNVTIGYDDVGNQVNTLTISGTYLQKIGIVSMDFFYSRGI